MSRGASELALPAKRPVVIGLLGGIASGKSSVAAALARRGAAVLDADAVARRSLAEPAVIAAIVARHGPSLLAADGASIDRPALARATFGNPDHLRHLEELLHPLVCRELVTDLDRLLHSPDVPAVVLDVPLLLESGPFADRCDLLLFVDSRPDQRAQRAATNRGWSSGEIERREAHQISLVEKRRRADVVVRNEGSEVELQQQVWQWLASAGGFSALPRNAPTWPSDTPL